MAAADLTPFGEAIVGAVGGMVSNAIVYPLDTFVALALSSPR